MPHVVEAGTDAASLWIFDPTALPDDFGVRFPADPNGTLDQFEREGRLVSVNTGADGAYLLHAFVDEPVAKSLAAYVVDPLTFPNLIVPSGHLYFVGGEFGSRDVERHLERYPHMGGSFALRPGKYKLTLWRTEYPDDHQENLFKAEVSNIAFTIHQSFGCLVTAVVVGAVVWGVSSFVAKQSVWYAIICGIEAILFCLLLIVRRLPIYRNADERWQAIGSQYPSVVAHLVFEGDSGLRDG